MKKLFSDISIFINQKRKIPRNYPFIMHPEEKDLFKALLSDSKNYLEFGLGGSPIFSLINSRTQIVSIDTNHSWIAFMKKFKIIQKFLGDRLKIYYIDIGPTKSWGLPINDSSQEKFENFSSQIFSLEDPKKFDVVLVDGRFRVACTLQTILNCNQNRNLKILIHDYSLREEYKEVEKFLTISEFSRTLYAFTIKENINYDEVKNSYEKFKNNPN
jgi:hypothetical protein